MKRPNQLSANANEPRSWSADAKIILAPTDPWSRNSILARALASDPTALYYAASESDTSAEIYLDNLFECFKMLASGPMQVDGAARGRWLAEALAGVTRTIILDEVDRLAAIGDPLFKFQTALGRALPDGAHLLLLGRYYDRQRWQPMIDAGLAVRLEAPPSNRSHQPREVYGFGSGRVINHGIPVTEWDGPLPRNLFFYFADHPMVTRHEVFQTFWPRMKLKDAINVFHVTKRKVAERVGLEFATYESGFYRTESTFSIYYDVAQFESLIDDARETPDDDDAWQRALHLYRRPFLYGVQVGWVAERRAELAAKYIEALIAVARICRSVDASRSLSYFLRVQREAPYREDIQRELMQLYAELGDWSALKAQYRQLEQRLKRAYGIIPGKATRELYARLAGNSRV